MDKLQNLLREAKPLYKTRKRRKMIATTLCAIAVPMFVFSFAAELCLEGNSFYVSFDNEKIQNELLQDDFGLLRL